MPERRNTIPSIADRLIGLVKDPNTGKFDPARVLGATHHVVGVEQILRRRAQVTVGVDPQPTLVEESQG